MSYDDQNIFAKILRGEVPCYKVYEDDHTLAFLDVFPRTDGHCLVIPKAAARNILDIEPEALSQVTTTVQKVAQAAKSALNAVGVTIEQNSEAAGGQSVFHLHFHVMPRFDGIALKPPMGDMGDADVLAPIAAKIAAKL